MHNLVFFTCLGVMLATTMPASIIGKTTNSKSVICHQLGENLLSEILGPAFNSRYMSIDPPIQEDVLHDDLDENVPTMGKRKVGLVPPFYVDNDYVREIADEPAWSVNHVAVAISLNSGSTTSLTRRKRTSAGKHTKGASRQWECESRINWIDLGTDYFPRYLRSVECTSKTCWYGHYKCKPRSFTVKILRRKTGRCTVAKAGSTIGIIGLPSDLRELWVWEERAVNFCCDCAI